MVFCFSNEDIGTTLHGFLSKKHFAKGLLKSLHKKNKVVVGDRAVPYSYKISETDQSVTITLKDDFVSDIQSVPMDIEVLYENEDILIVNKDAHMPTIPSRIHQDDTLANGVMAYYHGDFVYRPINRLDHGTSGIVMIAKNPWIQEFYKQNPPEKTYIAMTESNKIPDKGTIVGYIQKESIPGSIKRIVHPSEGQYSITHYEKWDQNKDYTFYKIALETGRTHQIRVHFESLGVPLVGDGIYGGKKVDDLNRQGLHANQITFVNPIDEKIITITAPLPKDMKNAFFGPK